MASEEMMAERSSTRLHAYRLPTGKSYLALITKRVHRLRPDGRLSVLVDAPPITDEPEYAESQNPGAGPRLIQDSDLFAAARPFTDVILVGSAHSRKGPVQSLEASLEVGPVKKTVRVFGERRVMLGSRGTLLFSPAERFTSMPLQWDHAYGGRDAYAEEKLFGRPDTAFGRARGGPEDAPHGQLLYPRNYAGRGFGIDLDRERFDGALLPNLEDPSDPLTPDRLLVKDPMAWIDCPASACFEPIDWLTFPRSAFFICPDHARPSRPLHEIRAGALVEADLEDPPPGQLPSNPRLYNAAPAGLAVRRLEGGERVKLSNLHRELDRIEFDLPAQRPQLVLEPQGVGVRELAPRLQEVRIAPDEETVTLLWVGTQETAAQFPPEMVAEMRHAVIWPA